MNIHQTYTRTTKARDGLLDHYGMCTCGAISLPFVDEARATAWECPMVLAGHEIAKAVAAFHQKDDPIICQYCGIEGEDCEPLCDCPSCRELDDEMELARLEHL